MNNNDYLKRFRGMIDVQNRKNTITGALVLVGIMAVLMPGAIFWFVKSDYVTYPLRGLTLSGTKTHVKQRFLPLTPLLMVSDDLWSPVLPA